MNLAARWTALIAVLVIGTGSRVRAEEAPGATRKAGASNVPPPAVTSVPLTNRALLLISRVRGVAPEQVKIFASNRAGGPFEIDIAGTKDAAKEAEHLSKELGATAAVILEQASDDGLVRTNWTFKSGTVRQLTAPVGKSGLGPSTRRLYVWPEPAMTPPTAPSKLRVREQLN